MNTPLVLIKHIFQTIVMTNSNNNANIFSAVKFYLMGEYQPCTVRILQERGGRRLSYLSGLVTHCIVGAHTDPRETEEAREVFDVPVVTEDWVTASAKCGHLLPARGFSITPDQLFSGITVVLSRDTLSSEDSARLWAMLTWYGGRVRVGCNDEGGTHLVCGRWKKEMFKLRMTPVSPDWVVESIRDGVKKKEVDYHPSQIVEVNEAEYYEEDKEVVINIKIEVLKDDVTALSEGSDTTLSSPNQKVNTTLSSPKQEVNTPRSSSNPEVNILLSSPHPEVNAPLSSPNPEVNTPRSSPNPEVKAPANPEVKAPLSSLNSHQELSPNSSFTSALSTLIPEGSEGSTTDYFSQDKDAEFSQNKSDASTCEYNDSTDDYGEDDNPAKKRKTGDECFVISSTQMSRRWSESDKFRQNYSRTEAMALINFFKEHGMYLMRGGIQVWKIIEKASICPGRSWQSLKSFFQKYLVKQLPSYGVTEKELEEKARSVDEVGRWGSWERKSKEKKMVASFYTTAEDKKILNYVIDHGRVEKASLGGEQDLDNAGEEEYPSRKVVCLFSTESTLFHCRSWQSLKERFRKKIVKNLRNYDLGESDIELIEILLHFF